MARNSGSGKLEITLPSDTQILMTRTLDAPRRLVFEAMTRPEHVRRWWCCTDGFTMTVCEIDLRIGGRWRYVIVGPPGEVAFNGVYQEIAPPERLVHTELLEPHPDGLIVTITLEERDGKTYYRSLSQAVSKEQRDAVIASGMEVGAELALERMEEVARSLDSSHVTKGQIARQA
jgi:uncharacterized protein YndB with AHSA1/START domain